MDFDRLLADRTKEMGASAVREILKVVAQPGMVSLAGGIPAPESFPLEIIGELTDKVIEKYGSAAFQYGPTEGFQPLREVLVDYLADKDITVQVDDVTIASGSQGVLDGLAKVLISRGDCVAVEAPTYLGALQAFNAYEPSYVSLDTDEEGLIPDSLEKILRTHHPKMVYLAPTFQNPSGRTIPLDRRRQIAAILKENKALLVEDDPYGALRYRGVEVPPIKSLAPDQVIYVSTLSKIFAPGLRIGFCAAPDPIRHWMVLAKQGVDLHTSTFNQALAAEYLAGGYLKEHLPKIIRLYKPKQEAMLEALEKYFPENFQWSKPEGGMFVWVEGPAGTDVEAVFSRSLERNVAFVPGRYFYTDPDKGLETMRLNYTMADEETIDRAVKTIGEAIGQATRPPK